jgi:hypothetical protein
MVAAVYGDGERERIRVAAADAERKERENQIAKRELIPMDEARQAIGGCLITIRQRLVAVPAELASSVNPSDPEFARKALEQWRDEVLKSCREDLLQPPKE